MKTHPDPRSETARPALQYLRQSGSGNRKDQRSKIKESKVKCKNKGQKTKDQLPGKSPLALGSFDSRRHDRGSGGAFDRALAPEDGSGDESNDKTDR